MLCKDPQLVFFQIYYKIKLVYLQGFIKYVPKMHMLAIGKHKTPAFKRKIIIWLINTWGYIYGIIIVCNLIDTYQHFW